MLSALVHSYSDVSIFTYKYKWAFFIFVIKLVFRKKAVFWSEKKYLASGNGIILLLLKVILYSVSSVPYKYFTKPSS